MIRLTTVELRRLASRKILWVCILGAAAIVISVLATVYLQARTIDLARAGMLEEYDRIVADHQRYVQECLQQEAQERRTTGNPTIDYGCEEGGPPTIEEMYGQMPSLAEQYTQLLQGLVYPFAFLALVLGSTAVAAEFAHRTMGSWLTFVPRRTPVFVSKVLAPMLASVPITLVGAGLTLVGVPVIFRWFRLDDGVTGQEWVDLGWMLLRLLVVVMVAAALGAGGGFLVRHSGVVVGVVVGYLVIVEGMVGSALSGVQRYLLARNISAFVQDGTTWEIWTDCDGINGCRSIEQSLSLEHGAMVMAVLLAVVLVVAWAKFRTADID